MSTTQVRVRCRRTRYGFDGQTAVLVLSGTCGWVSNMTIKGHERLDVRLTVFWEVALVQEQGNNDYSAVTDWEEDNLWIDDVTFEEVGRK